MAFIENDEENQLNQGQGPLVGQGTTEVGQGQNQAGVGAGGTGGWTNIQAYLGANADDTGSANALNKTVGDQFNKEKDAYTTDSANYLKGAQDQVSKSSISNDQANDYINQAANQYVYQGNAPSKDPIEKSPEGQTQFQDKTTPKSGGYQQPSQPTVSSDNMDEYGNIVSKFQKALTGQYSGPKDYNYGFSADTQNLGSQLKDNGGFDTLMNSVYSNSAGRPLSSGQFQLQKQLDVNNANLSNTRNSLNDQYAALGADRDKAVTDTTAGLGKLEQQYRNHQNSLKDYLTGQSNSYDTKVGQDEASARAAYQNTFANEGSGRRGTFQLVPGGAVDSAAFANRGIWGSNMTWDQLQKEQDYVNQNDPSTDLDDAVRAPFNSAWQPMRDQWLGNGQELQKFYQNQDAKYANAGDTDKRAFNTIQDFLNSGGKRKDAGFHVRG